MSISGASKIKRCSFAVGLTALFVGGPLITVGILIGASSGWHATAISLITVGGLCFVPGYFGGLAIKGRIQAYQREEDARIKAATTANLFDQSQDL